jgi:hypothetical protein
MRILFSFMVTIAPLATAVAKPLVTERTTLISDDLRRTAEVYFEAIRSPIGGLVLFKRGKLRCAVLISDAWREGRDREPSVWRSTDPDSYASYVAYYRSDGKDDLTSSGVSKRSGTLHAGPFYGFGRMVVWGGSSTLLKCGQLTIEWQPPTWWNFNPTKDIEAAPTAISDPSLVDFSDVRLTWYRRDENREPIVLQVGQF